MSEKTATQVNLDAMHEAIAFESIARNPELQARKIADHYLANALISQRLLHLCEYRERWGGGDVDRAINFIVNEIKQNHARDFGIKLEW